jgi:hypothetical protein
MVRHLLFCLHVLAFISFRVLTCHYSPFFCRHAATSAELRARSTRTSTIMATGKCRRYLFPCLRPKSLWSAFHVSQPLMPSITAF